MATLFDRIGPEKLRAVLADFYDRVFADVMIGFLFAGKDRERLIEKEWELTARLLGADVPYTGRPLREAHAASPILGGHFARRQQILREVLVAHDVAPEIREAWLAHAESLRPLVTTQSGGECDPD
jgi:hemoglobin